MIDSIMKGIIGFTEWLFKSVLTFLNYAAKSKVLSVLVIIFLLLWLF